jgi:hypothetical protein
MPTLDNTIRLSPLPANASSVSPLVTNTPRPTTRTLRSPTGSALRRSPRYSPYRAAGANSTPNRPQQSPSVTRRVGFSPQASPATPSRTTRSPSLPRQPRPSPLKTGRPRDEIWQHYVIEREGEKKHGRCKYCGTLKKNGKPSGNLLMHLTSSNQCPSVPREVQVALRPVATAELVASSSPAPQITPSVYSQDDFDMALARVFFVCALPFVLIEAPVFRLFLAMVAPTMKCPSRRKLSSVLLKRVRDELRVDIIRLINEQGFISIVTDGWSDTNSSSIINFMVVAPGMPSIFWSSWSTRSERHTAGW